MNIQHFINYLNKEKKWQIEGAYYSQITAWRDWWRGWFEPFHTVREMNLRRQLCKRPMYRLGMPKRACEDWASLLLNEKTTLTVQDAAAARWLLGEDADQTGGILGQLDFWTHANTLVELAFRSGTGAFVMSCEGLKVEGGKAVPSPEARLCLDYLPAECILPITIRHGQVMDVAFASQVTVEGKSCIYLQTHTLTDAGYQIDNEYFTSQNEDTDQEDYSPAALPEGMAASFSTGSPVPWFSLLRPAAVKNRTGGAGLGQAVFAEAIDAAKMCDLAFDNYCRDLYLGGKKVFYSASMLKPVIGADGSARWAAPDDIRQQLFVQTEKSDPDAPNDWHEYNPDLRCDQNGKAVQDALDYFSFKCGLGTRRYRFEASGIKTATEYTGDRQDMVQHANRHQIGIEAALLGIVRALLWAGRNLLGADIDPGTAVTVNFDDSYITDSDTRRAQMKDDCLAGFLPKYRYLCEWYGMSEADARAAVQEARTEASSGPALSFNGEL